MTTQTSAPTPAPVRRRRNTALLVLAVLIVAGAVVAIVYVVAGDDDAVEPEWTVTVLGVDDDEAFGEPGFADALVGQRVTVDGNVSLFVNADVVKLGGDRVGEGGVVVFGTDAPLGAGDFIRAVGTVAPFDADALEAEGYDVPDDRRDAYEGRNILVIEEMEVLGVPDRIG